MTPSILILLLLILLIYLFYNIFTQKPNEDVKTNTEENRYGKQRYSTELIPFDLDQHIYCFKLRFSLKYPEPMMLTLFKDENDRHSFGVNCIASHKYKIGYIYNIVHNPQSSIELRFNWDCFQYDGFFETVSVSIYRANDGFGNINCMCRIRSKDELVYIGTQLPDGFTNTELTAMFNKDFKVV